MKERWMLHVVDLGPISLKGSEQFKIYRKTVGQRRVFKLKLSTKKTLMKLCNCVCPFTFHIMLACWHAKCCRRCDVTPLILDAINVKSNTWELENMKETGGTKYEGIICTDIRMAKHNAEFRLNNWIFHFWFPHVTHRMTLHAGTCICISNFPETPNKCVLKMETARNTMAIDSTHWVRLTPELSILLVFVRSYGFKLLLAVVNWICRFK